jgi:hypothetical protein
MAAAPAAAAAEAEEAYSLASLPPEVLLNILRCAGARAVAAAACTCTRLRAVQAELAAVPAFSSALVRMVRAARVCACLVHVGAVM